MNDSPPSSDSDGSAPVSARRDQLITDPEVTGDLLLIGLTLDSLLAAGEPISIKRLHLLAYGPRGPRVRLDSDVREPAARHPRGGIDWLRCRTAYLLRQDARRYEPPEARDIVCGAPTARKPRCGKNVQRFALHTDWSSGERYHLGACNQHAAWFEARDAEQQATRPEVGEILPYANAGGLLARHVSEVDWPRLWRLLDPQWQEYPEREPVTPATPTLTVLLGEPETTPARQPVAVSTDDTAGRARPGGARRRNRVLYALDGGNP